MPHSEAYAVTDIKENSKGKSCLSTTPRDEAVYTYDEAIDLTGNGLYSMTLLATLCIANLSMGIDIFGFSVVVEGATCDFNLSVKETEILLAVTFVGPIVMAYPWGYISDTQGRRRSLLISLWTSFVVSVASSFSPNWIIMAVLKLISTCFSSCAQSVTYTLLGESCRKREGDAYMMIMTVLLDFSLAMYVGVAYLILNMSFSYNLGFITFTPWRFLNLALSLPLGLGAFGVLFFYESPKFMLNAERYEEALNALTGIWRINGGKGLYPVKRVILNEVGNIRPRDSTLLRSLWEQLIPIFKPPLLWRSLQLYFLTGIVYGTNNGYFMWFPYLAKKFIQGIQSDLNNGNTGLCTVIAGAYNVTTSNNTIKSCSSNMDISIFWSALTQGGLFAVVLFSVMRIAHRKRLLVIGFLSFAAFCALGAVLIDEMITSFFMFFGLLMNELIIGILYSYYVELYPTSFRGMAACLGNMVSRISALGGVSLLGHFLLSHCAQTFYVSSGLMIGGVLVGFLLPKDKLSKRNS